MADRGGLCRFRAGTARSRSGERRGFGDRRSVHAAASRPRYRALGAAGAPRGPRDPHSGPVPRRSRRFVVGAARARLPSADRKPVPKERRAQSRPSCHRPRRVTLTIPTEPIGSIPRSAALIASVAQGDSDDAALYEDAVRDTIERFEATGSPVVTDGEQWKYHDFATYCVHGAANLAPDGFTIAFADGHTRRLPRLTRGPFRYRQYADRHLDIAQP